MLSPAWLFALQGPRSTVNVSNFAAALLSPPRERTTEQQAHAWAVFRQDLLPEDGVMLMEFEVGEKYYIETLTKYWVGKVVRVTATQVDLEEASWVQDTGLMGEFIKTGKPQNLYVEPVGEWSVPIGIITGARRWPHRLWKEPVGR